MNKYSIWELDEQKKENLLFESLKDGNKHVEPVTGPDSQDQNLHIEAMSRFNNVNLFQLNCRIEKREQLLKELEQAQQNIFDKKLAQNH